MEQCKALREYADFVQMVRVYYQECKEEKEAIKKALEQAIQKNYLDGYLEKERNEVFMTTLFEVKRDIYENDLREEGREEGRVEGREEGRKEGREEVQIELIKNMFLNGINMEKIAVITQKSIAELNNILETNF